MRPRALRHVIGTRSARGSTRPQPSAHAVVTTLGGNRSGWSRLAVGTAKNRALRRRSSRPQLWRSGGCRPRRAKSQLFGECHLGAIRKALSPPTSGASPARVSVLSCFRRLRLRITRPLTHHVPTESSMKQIDRCDLSHPGPSEDWKRRGKVSHRTRRRMAGAELAEARIVRKPCKPANPLPLHVVGGRQCSLPTKRRHSLRRLFDGASTVETRSHLGYRRATSVE